MDTVFGEAGMFQELLFGEAGMFRNGWTNDDASFGEGDVEGGPAQVAATPSVLQEPRPEGLISHANTTMYRGKVVQTRDAGGLVLDPANQGEWSRFYRDFAESGIIESENFRIRSVRQCYSTIEPAARSVFLRIWRRVAFPVQVVDQLRPSWTVRGNEQAIVWARPPPGSGETATPRRLNIGDRVAFAVKRSHGGLEAEKIMLVYDGTVKARDSHGGIVIKPQLQFYDDHHEHFLTDNLRAGSVRTFASCHRSAA